MRMHFQSPAPAPAATTPSADDRSTTFRAVEGGSEMQSGEKLLVEAYAALWLILFGLILISWRRQKAIDARVVTLESELAKVRAAPAGESRKSGGA